MRKIQSIAEAMKPKRSKPQPRGGSYLQSVKDRCSTLEHEVATLTAALKELSDEVFK